MIVVYVFLAIALLLLAGLYVLYDMIFKKKNRGANGIVKKFLKYEKYKASIKDNINRINSLNYEKVRITSADNHKLNAKYYEFKAGAPVAIFFHGYRSYAEFDGGFLFGIFRDYGCNVLLVEQRAHGESKVKSITFGVRESDDCVRWVNFIGRRCGAGTKVILSGMSMGAATVMMASDADFGADVRGIIADCGFCSPGGALKHSMKLRGYPPKLTYFFSRLAAVIFAGFDPESKTAVDSLSKTKIPLLIIHGDEDLLVPYEMSIKNYNAANCYKKLVTVHGAGHAVSGGVNPELYRNEVEAFLGKVLTRGSEEKAL